MNLSDLRKITISLVEMKALWDVILHLTCKYSTALSVIATKGEKSNHPLESLGAQAAAMDELIK